MSADAAKYWAFISYSHRDAKAAAALQRALETCRVPKRLVGRHTAAGEVPAFLKPVFRDREELQAGADLQATVREALAQSRYLIVVCSPEAARSPWVNQEIIEFKKLHGESRVLAVINAGEPFGSRMPGREADECFPEALRFALTPAGLPQGPPLEPIAADLRPQGDGERLATLKLVAGMVGVGVDELVRRDVQRRARRMAMVATASVAGMAVMAVLTVTAMQSRNEAQSQRAQAEDLIEFMLGDLRKKLEPVGRLDVLDSVGAKALGYYAKQDADRLDANALGHRSRAMHLIGEMREKRGTLDEALVAFQSAADTTAKLVARTPNDGQRIFDHAQSVYWVGYIAWRRGQARAAEEAFRKYLELAQQLVRIDPANPDWGAEVAFAHSNLGTVLLGTSRPADALKEYTEAGEPLSRLSIKRPELAFEVAHNFGWIAKAREALGDYRGAMEAQQSKIDAFRRLPDADKNRQVQRGLQNAAYELARLEMTLGNPRSAEQFAETAVRQAQALVAADPENKYWLEQLYFALTLLAGSEAALDERAKALESIRQALDGSAKLVALDATVANWQVNLRGRALALAAQLAVADNRAALSSEIEAYLAKVQRFSSGDKALDEHQNVIVAYAEFMLGDLLSLDKPRDPRAVTHWQATVDRLQRHAAGSDMNAATLLAYAQWRLGSVDQARTLAARIESTHYRHPAYADLVRLLSNGAGPSIAQSSARRP